MLLATASCLAETNEIHVDILRTADGQTYSNATVKPMNAAFAIVDFDAGGAKVAFTNLPQDIQALLGFDSAKARAELDLEGYKKQQTKEANEAAIEAQREAQKDRLYRIVEGKIVSVSAFAEIHGLVFDVKPNGLEIQLYDHIAQNHRYSGVVSDNGGDGAYTGPAGGGAFTTYTDQLNGQMAFIHCPIRNIAEGQDWRG